MKTTFRRAALLIQQVWKTWRSGSVRTARTERRLSTWQVWQRRTPPRSPTTRMSLTEMMSVKAMTKPEKDLVDSPKQEMKRKVRIVFLSARQAICVLYVIWDTRGGRKMTIALTRQYIRATNLSKWDKESIKIIWRNSEHGSSGWSWVWVRCHFFLFDLEFFLLPSEYCRRVWFLLSWTERPGRQRPTNFWLSVPGNMTCWGRSEDRPFWSWWVSIGLSA